MHVERTFAVNRPQDEVFAYLADFEHTNAWDPGTVRTVRRTGDGGRGTTYENRSAFLGREVELIYTTIVHEPPAFVRFRGRNRWSTTTDSLWVTDDGAGSRIRYRADFVFGFPLNLVAPLVVRRRLDTLADETVDSLRAALASGPIS